MLASVSGVCLLIGRLRAGVEPSSNRRIAPWMSGRPGPSAKRA